jgi:hypothetical protein
MGGVRLRIHNEGIGLAGAVIYKSNHVEGDTLTAVGRLKGSAMSPGFMSIEQNTTDDAPNSGRVTAALSCAVDWENLAMFVVFIGDAKECFQFVFAFLKCRRHNEGHIFVNPKFPTGNCGEGGENVIVT